VARFYEKQQNATNLNISVPITAKKIKTGWNSCYEL